MTKEQTIITTTFTTVVTISTLFLLASFLYPETAEFVVNFFGWWLVGGLGLSTFCGATIGLSWVVRSWAITLEQVERTRQTRLETRSKSWQVIEPNQALLNLVSGTVQLPHAYHLTKDSQMMLMKNGDPLALVDNRRQPMSTAPQPNYTPTSIPPIRDDYWFGEVIGQLKQEMDQYSQPMTARISGNPGTGKTLLAMNLLAELIKPFDRADIEILDRKAYHTPKKWGNLKVLADTIEAYPSAMETLQAEMNQRTADSDPLFAIIDETDEAYHTYGKQWESQVANILSVGRELKLNPFVIGQSPLTKDSGLNSVVKTYFTLWVVLGLEGIEQFLNSGDCRWAKEDKQAYKSQLNSITSHRFIGLAMPSRFVSKPFLFVTPRLTLPTLNQTVNRSILELPVCLSASDRRGWQGLQGYNGQTDRQTTLKAALHKLHAEGIPLATGKMRRALRDNGYSFDNGLLSQLLVELRKEEKQPPC